MERFLEYFIPQNYKLNFVINQSKTSLIGNAIITGVTEANTIKFHAKNIQIKSIKVNQKNIKYITEPDAIIMALA